MGLGLGLRAKFNCLTEEIRIRMINTFGKPKLFSMGSAERLGAIYRQPTDMCVADRTLLYALVRGLMPTRVLEIGVRWGGGARIIASALEDAGGKGKAVGIDPAPELFRIKARELFGRYELFSGYSPQAIPAAVEKLGGPVEFALIDAMHTHDHVLADFSGLVPYLAPGAHVLLHDAFHQGIDAAISEVLASEPELVDCGILSRHPEITEAPVAYQGLHLVRMGPTNSRTLLERAYDERGLLPPRVASDLYNWDHFWNRIKDGPKEHA